MPSARCGIPTKASEGPSQVPHALRLSDQLDGRVGHPLAGRVGVSHSPLTLNAPTRAGRPKKNENKELHEKENSISHAATHQSLSQLRREETPRRGVIALSLSDLLPFQGGAMDEPDRHPPCRRVMRKRGGTERHHDASASAEDDRGSEDRDTIECTGKHCQSCTGAVIADCVALCCCPCAVVNLLTLAFIKVPWMVGRRCLRRLSKRQRKKHHKRLEVTGKCHCQGSFSSCGRDSLSEGMIEFTVGFGLEERIRRHSFGGGSWFEAEKGGWLELYPVGHLSFGRVSFTGIQLQPSI